MHFTGSVVCFISFPSSSVLPADPQSLGDEGEDVRLLQDGFGGGLSRPVPAAGVHPHHERLLLLGAAAHAVLQGGAELQRVQGHHAVVVIRRQEQDGRVGRAGVGGRGKIMERRIPARGQQRPENEGKGPS